MPEQSVKLCECGCGEPTPIADRSRPGITKGEGIRFIHGHNRRRFQPVWAEEDCGYETPCHVWQGARDRVGYGRAPMTNGYRTLAHRQTWADAYGPIPADMEVCHRCDVPPCVRLDHLFLGTHADNMADMHAKGRARPNCGESNHNAKLTDAAVAVIRTSDATQRELAERYGVDPSLISLVQRGKIWRSSST